MRFGGGPDGSRVDPPAEKLKLIVAPREGAGARRNRFARGEDSGKSNFLRYNNCLFLRLFVLVGYLVSYN